MATLLSLYVFAELNIISQNIVKILLDLILNASHSEFQELFVIMVDDEIMGYYKTTLCTHKILYIWRLKTTNILVQ